jgi:hypothetical protein
MKNSGIVLDHDQGIILDPTNPPFNNYQAFQHNYSGLKILADAVREAELKVIANDPHASHVVMHMSGNIHPIIPCAFNWFSVTVVNYLRLVALVDLMTKNNWKSSALGDAANRQTIKKHCTDYVRNAVPKIYRWRNKVSAHFAATDPFSDDTLGTLEQSIMNPISYTYPYYYVGMLQWHTRGTESELPTWALTETYERLSPRYWPEMKLCEIPKDGL